MIYTMQLFNFIKFNFKNLMNLPNLYCSGHLREFEKKKKIPNFNQLNKKPLPN